MKVIIDLPTKHHQVLTKLAERRGLQMSHYAEDLLRKLIERELASSASGVAKAPEADAAPLAEVLEDAVNVIESLAAQLAVLDTNGHMLNNFLNELGMLPESDLIRRIRETLQPA